MKNFLFCIAIGFLSACSSMTTENTHTTFDPKISSGDLEFIFQRLLSYIDSPSPSDEYSAKQLVLERGGLRDRPITVELPDHSLIQIKIVSGDTILVSGHEDKAEPWITISIIKETFYLSVGPPPGVGGFAEFEISKAGRVKDIGVLIACP